MQYVKVSIVKYTTTTSHLSMGAMTVLDRILARPPARKSEANECTNRLVFGATAGLVDMCLSIANSCCDDIRGLDGVQVAGGLHAVE